MTKVLNSFFAAALMLTATSVAAYDPPEMANWQIKAKEKALQLHERTFGGEAFDYGYPTPFENRVNWARDSEEARKTSVGNVDLKHLKKLLSNSVTVEWDMEDWGKLHRSRFLRIARYTPDGKRVGCMLKLDSRAAIIKTYEAIGYWDVSGTDMGLGASGYDYQPTLEELKKSMIENGPTVPIYDRTNGLFASNSYHDGDMLIFAGSIQSGVPKFAYDACEVYQNIPDIKVVEDQIVPDFNTHMKDKSTFVKKKVPTLFPQDIVNPLTAEMLYFDLDPDRYARRVITLSFD